MQRTTVHRQHPILYTLMFIISLLVPFLFIVLASTAFQLVGLTTGEAFLILLGSFVGSAINIPLITLKSKAIPCPHYHLRVFGLVYHIPDCPEPRRTLLAVNVGGGIIPVGLSLWLIYRIWVIYRNPWDLASLLFTLILCSLIINQLAQVRRGIGIVTPALAPPVTAALLALVFASSAPIRPVMAYVSGTLGALIGADLMNLRKIATIDAPVASIGGAGTWDGIFLTGIVAVLLV